MSFSETAKQVLCLALCLSLVPEQKTLLCEDQSFTSSGSSDPLAEFSSYIFHRMPGASKVYFQQLSVKECAQLCLQVAEGNIFNCTSFEYVTATTDCFLMDTLCEDHKLLADNSRHFYQLEGANEKITCATISSSSSVTSSFIQSLSTVHTSSVSSKGSPGFHNLSVQVTILLRNESWKVSLINTSSLMFMNISSRIKQNVFQDFSDNSSLLEVTVLQLRNSSGLVAVEFSLSFSQEFHMRHINKFYSSLYETQHLGLIPIDVINDTIPGKPPENMNVTIISPTALQLSWSPLRTQGIVNTWGLQVSYQAHDNKTDSILVDKHRAEVNISQLRPDTTYTIWVIPVTSKGFGFSSQVLNVTTPYRAPKDIIIKLTVLFPNVTWNAQFENRSSDVFMNFSSLIKKSVTVIHQNESSYKNISSLRFSNYSSGTIVFSDVSYNGGSRMTNFYDIYEALYKQKSLGDLHIEVMDDNIPGKPPTNITPLALSPSSIAINWNLLQSNHCEIFPLLGFRVFYSFRNKENAMVTHSVNVNKSINNVVIQDLENFEYYLIWVQAITSRDLGPKSKAVKTRTLEQVISVNVTILLQVPWVPALLNNTNQAFNNLTTRIEQNVYLLYENDAQLRKVMCHKFTNESGKTAAEVEIKFGQHVLMSAFILLYKELYENGTLGNMTVTPISDNIPGKPPTNMSVKATNPTSVEIKWKFALPSYEPVIPNKALRIFYKLQGNTTVQNFQDTNVTTGFNTLDKLKTFSWYTIWVKSVTSRGLGVESDRFKIRTLEEVVPINMTVRLPGRNWTADLFNAASEAFSNLSKLLQIKVEEIYRNETHLRDIVIHRFRNDGGKVVVDMEIIFGQYVEMELFITLYRALHMNGSFVDLPVQPIWDNIPGKPPQNVSGHATGTTSIQVEWTTVPVESDVILLSVFYVKTSKPNETISRTDVNVTKRSVKITNLGKFVNYTVWVKSVSTRGPGISSIPIYVQTLEEVVPVNLTVRLNDVKWDRNLSDPESDNFKTLARTIQQNVYLLYGPQSSYLRNVQCHQFRNGSVLADMTIVYGQSVEPKQFAVIFKALYEDGKLGNLTVQPVKDNVPGKPPTNVSAKSDTSTSIKVTWLCTDCHQHNTTIGFLISYKLDNSNQTLAVAVNRTVRDFLISGLKKFSNYTMFVSSVTARGISMSSKRLSVRTLEDVPSLAPVNLRAHNMSSTRLLVAWEPLPEDQVNGILLGYKVTYSKYGEIDARKQNVSAMLNLTILSGLEKFTVYHVNVSAFTRVGNGPEANVTASTDQDVPSLPPTDIRTYNTSSTSLEVTWNPVPQGYTHGIVLGYMVLYKRTKDSNNSYINITSPVTSVQLTDLNKFTMYLVKVLAFTIKGNGAVTNGTQARTHEDVPSLPPTRLTAYNTSSTSVMVTWLPVPDGYVHGILRGYRLLFKIDENSYYQNVTTVNQSFELAGLEKFTNYSMKVLAYTRIGDGNVSDPVIVSTDEDVPSLPPQNVSSYNTSSTSLYVSWHEVSHGFVHGILLGYRVLYKVASEIHNNSVVSTSQTTKEKELQGLKKFTMYEIAVLAFTRIGDGVNSTSIFVSTDEDIPSQPPTDLAAYNTSSTSLQVTWGEVPKGFVHGILLGYRVFYKRTGDKNDSYVNSTTGPNERKLHISGLEKFTAYSVKVLAFTRKGDGAVSINISVLTDEDVPSLPPQSVQSYNTSSTSVNVTWHEVPTGFVHGILRGYRVFYSRTQLQGASVKYAVVPANKRYVHLKGLNKFTNYTVQVAAFTRIGYGALSSDVIVSTDEDVPSLPPQNLRGNNISSTALRITWNPVPTGFVHGILRGYRVLYRKKNEPFAPYTKITISPRVRVKEIYGLKKFTFYTIRVLAFTIKGDGAQSPPVNVSTDEDIPSEQPQNVYAKDKASATVIYLSWERPPEHTIHGILRGYYIWYSIISLGINDKTPIFPQDYRKKQLPAASKNDALTDLESYATYDIKIAAFTSKGYGPIKDLSSRTCRCRSTIPTNWWNNPPYVNSQPYSNRSKESGILPTILELIVSHCCQACQEFGSATIDFTTDANGLEAEKDGVIDVKDSISTKTMISFGIAGVMPQEKYYSPDGIAEYVPIMETPGVAFIVAEKRDIHKEVLLAILSCWPAVLIACIMTYMAGIVVWALDMNWNRVDFPKSFFSGSLEGFWWSFVTMTTVGYGDRIPKSIPARLFAFLWTWTGIATIAVITSSITASLMGMVFRPEKMIYGTKLAAITNSTEYKLGLRRNAILNPDHSYGNLFDIFEDLEKDRIHAALLDSYSTASESKMFSKDWLRVIEIIPVRYESANGVVLTGDVMKLARCFRRYVKSETSTIHRIIQRNVGTIEADDVPFAVKTSADLLTDESYLYKRTVIILGSSLAVFTLSGLLVHFCFYKKTISPQSSESEGQVATPVKPQTTRREIGEQLKQDITEFYARFRPKYLALRRKHIKELKELRKLSNNNNCTDVRRLPEFSAILDRKGHYAVTRDADVNSILEGLDMTIFDKRSSKRWYFEQQKVSI